MGWNPLRTMGASGDFHDGLHSVCYRRLLLSREPLKGDLPLRDSRAAALSWSVLRCSVAYTTVVLKKRYWTRIPLLYAPGYTFISKTTEMHKRFHCSFPSDSQKGLERSSVQLFILPTRKLEPRGAKPRAQGHTAG